MEGGQLQDSRGTVSGTQSNQVLENVKSHVGKVKEYRVSTSLRQGHRESFGDRNLGQFRGSKVATLN